MPVPKMPNRFLCSITLDIMFDPVLSHTDVTMKELQLKDDLKRT